MRANEFVKKFGYKHNAVNLKYLPLNQHAELERLVESHELVEKVGGLALAKIELKSVDYNSEKDFYENLKQAIADVESCQ